MLEILKKVAQKRLDRNDENYKIQLSSVLMGKAVEELKKITNLIGHGFIINQISSEFQYVMYGKTFTIINRAYRDDTNDPEVEEILYELAIHNL